RQKPWIVHYIGIAALQANHFTEFFTSLAACDYLLCQFSAFINGAHAFAEQEHPRGENYAEFAQVIRTMRTIWTLAIQDFNTFSDFQRIAHGASKRLAHIGNQSRNAFAQALSGFHHE